MQKYWVPKNYLLNDPPGPGSEGTEVVEVDAVEQVLEEIEGLTQSRLVAETYLPEIATILKFTGYDKVQNTTYLPLTAGWCENLRIAIADLTAQLADAQGRIATMNPMCQHEKIGCLYLQLCEQRDLAISQCNKSEGRIKELETDVVPRSRYDACNQDWLDAQAKLRQVQEQARIEIENLNGTLRRIIIERDTLTTRLAEVEQSLEQQRTATYQAVKREHAAKKSLAQREEALNLIINWYDGTPASQGGTLDGLVRIIKHALTPPPAAEAHDDKEA